MKKFISALISAAMLCTFAVPAFAEVTEAPQISVVVNGARLSFGDNIPMSENFRTLVPMRAIFEALGAEVGWDENTLTATAAIGNKVIDVQINRASIGINGELREIDVPARQVYDKYTYVPVRAVSEAFGADVQWDENTQTVTITASASPEKTEPPVIPNNLPTAITDGADVLIKVCDIEITKADFRQYLVQSNTQIYNEFIRSNNIADAAELDGKFSWSDENISRSKEIALDSAVNDALMLQLAAENNISLSEEDNTQISGYMAQIKSSYGEDYGKAMGANGFLSEDDFLKALRRTKIISNMTKEFSGNRSKYTSDGALSQYTDDETVSAQHVLISFETTGKDGEVVKRTDSEALAIAESVKKKADNGEDFNKLMEEFNEDPGEPAEGYTFGKGEMVKEFEEMSFALKIGEISKPVKTTYGYHVIKRVAGLTEVLNKLRATVQVIVDDGGLNSAPIELAAERPY